MSKIIKSAFALLLAVSMVGCGRPKTLEGFVEKDKEIAEAIKSNDDENSFASITTSIEDNDVIFTMKLKKEVSQTVIRKLNETYDKSFYKDDMKSRVDILEEGTGLSDIRIKLIGYDVNGKEIMRKIYTN